MFNYIFKCLRIIILSICLSYFRCKSNSYVECEKVIKMRIVDKTAAIKLRFLKIKWIMTNRGNKQIFEILKLMQHGCHDKDKGSYDKISWIINKLILYKIL